VPQQPAEPLAHHHVLRPKAFNRIGRLGQQWRQVAGGQVGLPFGTVAELDSCHFRAGKRLGNPGNIGTRRRLVRPRKRRAAQ